MRIKQIEVSRLFGVFDHIVPLKVSDHVTIIHGPNGLGKTILLKMVDGIFNTRYSLLRSVPFKRLRIIFDDESSLEVTQLREQEGSKRRRDHDGVRIQFALTRSGAERQFYTYTQSELMHGLPLAEAIDRFVPFLSRVGHDTFQHVESGEIFSINEALELFSPYLPSGARGGSEEAWFTNLKRSISVHLIDTERLAPVVLQERDHKAARTRSESRLSVTRYSNDIAKRIQARLAESAALTQSLDRTFPARLVQQGALSQLTADEVHTRLSQLEQKRVQLKSVGLLDKADDMQFQVPPQMDDSTKGVLAVYVQDVEKKLGIFDDLAARITLFQQMVNDRFLFKTLSISKDHGFAFASRDGTELSPSDLSSGEQHEVVLLYDLLFKVQPNSLIMIDEPELSLHVAWQELFLKDLQAITSLTAFDVLIATHSPQIIHDRWDLTVELSGPSK